MIRNLLILLLLAVFLLGCSSRPTVTRQDPSTQTDLSGRWNDTDSRMVSEEMIKDCLNNPWLQQHVQKKGKAPVITVGTIRNKSSEHIPVETFINDISRTFINSGQVQVAASPLERTDIRAEKDDQQDNASAETMKKLHEETGADFMMIGSINTLVDAVEGEKVVYYQVDLKLVNLENNLTSWIGQKKIKKDIEHSGSSW